MKANPKPARRSHHKTRPQNPPQENERSSTRQFPATATTIEGDVLPVETSESPETKAAEISELKRKYETGESPEDEKKQVRAKTVQAAKLSGEEQAKRIETFAGSLGALAKVGTQLLCAFLPNPTPPTELEIQLLNESLSVVAQKHFDKLLEYDAELSLLVITLAIVLPRLKKPAATVIDLATAKKQLDEAAALVKKIEEEAAKKTETKKSEEAIPKVA